MSNKYGPPKRINPTHAEKKEFKRLYANHYSFCSENGYHTWEQYQAKLKPRQKAFEERREAIQKMAESNFEKGRRILREKGLAKR